MRQVFLLLMMCVGGFLNMEAQDSLELQPLLREMVTLKYDKPQGYDLGDTIHFEAWVMREGKEGGTDYSRVLYVELLNPRASVTARKILRLEDGRAKGAIWVDSLYGSGFYELRAYTRYMTNWKDVKYFTRVIPVFAVEKTDRKGEVKEERIIWTQTTRTVDDRSPAAQRLLTYSDTVYSLVQPVEKNLMVFGHIEPKWKQQTEDDKRLEGRGMKVSIQQGKTVYVGDAETDSLGRYALLFPDVQGDWTLRIREQKGQRVLNRHYVMVDCIFAPAPRPLRASELAPVLYGVKKWKNDSSREKWMSRFLNSDEASTRMKNWGAVSLGFYAYLGKVDRRFERTVGVASPTILNVARDSAYNKYMDINLMGHDSNDPRTVCVDGPCFQGRPIVWIVNGAYRLVTGLKKEITDFQVMRPTRRSMPIYVDEVKSVYITDCPDAFHPYVRCSVLEKKRPVTVFVTLHEHYVWDDSGLFSMSFDGFSE